MKDIYLKAIETIYRLLAGGDAYDLIVATANSLMREDKTNDEKRAMVKAAVMPIIRSWGKEILSAIIAFAVTSLKREMEKRLEEAQNGR